jgi:hypothetical protein
LLRGKRQLAAPEIYLAQIVHYARAMVEADKVIRDLHARQRDTEATHVEFLREQAAYGLYHARRDLWRDVS